MAQTSILQRLYPHLAAFVIFLLAAVLYFLPQLQGKVLQAGDIVSYQGMAREINDFKKETGERSLWTNSMFGGMPTYQIDSAQPSNVLSYAEKASQLFISRPIGYFFAMAFIFYFLLIYLKVNPWLSIIGALAFSFSVGNMTLLEAGHMSKLRVISSFALIAIGMLMAFRKEYLKGGILYALGLGMSLYANHVQMTYYFFLALGIYGIIEIVQRSKTGDWASFGKAVGVLVLATLIGVGSSTSKLWTTYEYAKDTMRGEPILTSSNASPQSSSETNGLEWEYAMQWSNGWLDLASAIIPGIAGGGSAESVGTDSELYKDLKRKGANIGPDFKAPLYWGSLPFTSGPFYFGAIFCFLFILGLVLVKGPVKWWLGFATLLFLLLSMGKNFAILNQLMFDYFPMFNKFRTPNSVLTVAGFFVPVLGMLAVSDILRQKVSTEEVMKGLKIALGVAGGFCLFFALLGPSMFDFTNPGDARLAQAGYDLQALYADRKALMRSDSIRSLLLILASGGLIWAFINNKIKSTLLIAAIGILAIGDIWLVDKRYVDDSNFVKSSAYENNFKPRPVDQQIMQDKDLHYRVYDMSINTFNSASSSYFHNTIGGYNAAKLQRFQDLIDRHISQGNQAVLAMLNTKYVITQDQQAQRFPGLGNAWMVNEIKMVNTANEEIDALNGLEPGKTAVVNQEFSSYVSGLSPAGTGKIMLKEYRPNYLKYESNSTAEELAVFSEVWYGPDKGWQAYLDGQPVDHIRVDYILRALKIPAGTHTIEFKFEPRAFMLGEKITLIFSLLILLGFLGVFGYDLYQKKLAIDHAPAPPAQTAREKKSPPATKSKRKGKKK